MSQLPRQYALLLCALFLLLTGPWMTAQALEGDAQQPMYIEADDVEVREGEHTSIYVGNVKVTQGSMVLLADHVTVYHRDDRRPKYIIAIGNPAKFRQLLDNDKGEMHAFGLRMEYDADKDELTLIGKALVIQGDDRVAGDRIVYDRIQQKIRAGGSDRVKITLTPEEKKDQEDH